jgi:predicted TIM-barrel fold metal-dependent hydrolase
MIRLIPNLTPLLSAAISPFLGRRRLHSLILTLGAAAAGSGPVTGLAQPSLEASREGVVYQGQTIPATDLHLHPGSYDSLGPLGKAFILKNLPGFLPDFLKDWSLRTVASLVQNPYGTFIGIKTQCLESGFIKCGLFTTHAPETWGVVDNQTVRGWLEDSRNINPRTQKPLFFGLATLSIQNWERDGEAQLQQLDRDLDFPLFRGIKLAFIHNNTPLDDPRFDGIYDVAARRSTPVYHHVGSSPIRKLTDFRDPAEREKYLRSYSPTYLERAIAAYPSVPFILGHMGFDFNNEGFMFDEDVLRLALTYPNVYLEISAFGNSVYDPDGRFKDNVLRRIKEAGLIDRTLYGSDGPGAPGGIKRYLEGILASMDRVGYSVAEAQKVLSDNTGLLFGLN